jgi:long-chain acyl-CoA synthetase
MTVTLADKPWLKNYDEGVPHEIKIPKHTLHHFLERSAKNYADNTALVYRGTEISYRDLNKAAEDIAAGLRASGFKKGDRAVIYMPNCPQFVMSYYGILKAGGVVIATNPLYTERELKHQLKDCGAETVFVLTSFYDLLKKVQESGETNVKRVIATNVKEYFPFMLKLLFTLLKEKKGGHRVHLKDGDTWFQDFLKMGSKAPRAKVDVSAEDMALFQYTGGTTGLSKGAIGLHRNMVANVYQLAAWMPKMEKGKEVMLTSIPLFHSYGMVAAMHLSLAFGFKMVLIVDPRDQKDVLSSIEKYKVTLFPGVPTMYNAVNNNPDVKAGKYDLKSIKYCFSGAAPLLLEVKQKFEAITGATLVEAYGMSETHVAATANPLEGRNIAGSIGLPLPNMELRVVDSNDPTKDLGLNQIGELAMKGPNIMQGYWNMPEATADTLVDGWLFSGDVVEVDDEGYVYIRDRKKDMIIAGGYNIYPREVEEVLTAHPDVLECAVAGIMDPKRGETVKAWVVKQPGATITEKELIDWSKGELAAYKYPRVIEFRDELPKSGVGKILKRELVKDEKA